MKRRRATFQSVANQVENKGKRRRKIRDEYDKLDRISALPDDILVYLVSRLPLKDVVATSVLSRRWQNVGLSTMTLRFDAVDFSNLNHFQRYWCRPEEFIERESCKYINWVNHVLQQHRGKRIEEFRVSFCLDSRFSSFINGLIQFAMEESVEILELDFYPEVSRDLNSISFPTNVWGSAFQVLALVDTILVSSPSKFFRFDLLVLLEKFSSISYPAVYYFKRLSVTAAQDLVNLRVVGPLISLKYLVIHSCNNLKSIEIRDVNLVSFSYRGYRSTNIVISNAPLLSEVTVWKECWQKDFIRLFFTQCCLSNIKILRLHIHGACIENRALPLLANLKHLELHVVANYYRALHYLNNFLTASPYLLRLVLKLQLLPGGPSCPQIGEIEEAPDCPHNHLKVVEIVGYRAHTTGVEHVKYLVKNVVSLEKIVIDPVQRWRYPHGVDRPDTKHDKEIKARDHAMEYLQQ